MILKNDLKRKNTNIIEINNKMQFHASELNKTNQILMELPLFRNLMDEKEELEEHVNMLKHNIMYFESTNRKLLKKVEKLKSEIKTMKKNKKSKNDYIKQEKITEDDDDDVVFINQKDATVVQPAIQMVIEEGDYHTGLITCSTVQIKANEEYDDKLLAEIDDELSVGQELGEHESKENAIEGEEEEEVEVVEGEEEVEVIEEEEEEVEVVEGEEEEEVEVIEGEEEVEIVEGEEEVEVVEGEEEVEVVEGEEEVEVVEGEEEVEVVEGEEEVEIVEGEEEEGEGDEDVYEIEINGNTYYVSNEKDSVIYAADENGEITIEAGVYKNGKPVFH